MGKITVAFDGKPLFDWKGSAEQVDRIEAPLKRLAEVGNTTVEGFTMSAVFAMARHSGFFTSNQQVEMMAAVYFLLNQPTHHPDHPGRYRDYLPAWDFDFNIHDIDDEKRKFVMAVEGTFGGIKQVWPRFN